MKNNLTEKEYASAIRSAIWGFVVGDALGVPYEFLEREDIRIEPCTGMSGYGTHEQPPGTWSDDSSMMLCVLENCLNGGDARSLANLFLKWYREGYMTAGGSVFDIGNTTRMALTRLEMGHTASTSGLDHEASRGNGSMMRCLPYAFGSNFSKSMFEMIKANRITHADSLCHECCIFYIRLVRSLIDGMDKAEALQSAGAFLRFGWRITDDDMNEDSILHKSLFKRLFDPSFPALPEKEIRSQGYVIDTLEASIWCFMTCNSYPEAVMKAVNLGGDTDTIAALTGALAGIYFRHEDIPEDWIKSIRNRECVQSLIEKASVTRFYI
jgi:ADP-ribosyl-[dinitrogen reductase] hydrolase